MASPTSVVYVEKPANILLSAYFVEMRIWLDAHNITPLDFRLFGGLRVGFEIRFSSPEQASLFEQEFGAKVYPTTVAPLIFADRPASDHVGRRPKCVGYARRPLRDWARLSH